MPLKWSHFFSAGFASITALTEGPHLFKRLLVNWNKALAVFSLEEWNMLIVSLETQSWGIGGGLALPVQGCLGESNEPPWTILLGRVRVGFLFAGAGWTEAQFYNVYSNTSPKAVVQLSCFAWVEHRLQICTGDMAGWQTAAGCCGIHRLENVSVINRDLPCSSLCLLNSWNREAGWKDAVVSKNPSKNIMPV